MVRTTSRSGGGSDRNLPAMSMLLLSLLGLFGYLAGERFLLKRRIASVPLRITVTGTRGKSSVVRLLASVLREDGRRVVAKTTGSRASCIMPDGSERNIPRRGMASIIEQKKFVQMAARMNADCLIAEIMSLHPENHIIESQVLLQPDVVLMTNVRVDHIDAMGGQEDQIASIYALDIPPGAKVIAPESEIRGPLERAVYRANADLITVPGRTASSDSGGGRLMAGGNFLENLDLVRSAARELGVTDETTERGIANAEADRGALRIWRYAHKEGRECFLVSGFAANDPKSSECIIDALPEILPEMSGRPVGLLSLRADRGDRTAHWIEELKAGLIDRFVRFFVVGTHSVAMSRNLSEIRVVKSRKSEQVMQAVLAEIEDGTAIVGMGNFIGMGEKMISHWQSLGTEYEL